MKIIRKEQVKKINPIKEQYCKLAGLDYNTKLTEDMLDKELVKKIGIDKRMIECDIRKQLTEDVTIDQAAEAQHNDIDADDTKTDIERILDRALKRSKAAARHKERGEYPAILLEGDAGVGKTSIVEQWVRQNGLTMATIDVAKMPVELIKGVLFRDPKDVYTVTRNLSNEIFRKLSKPNTILFMDEYNRGDAETRSLLLTLVLRHTLPIPATEEAEKYFSQYGEVVADGTLYFPNLLFVVAAQNPYSTAYSGTKPLDAAEVDRFTIERIVANPAQVLRYAKNYFNDEIKAAQEAEDAEGVKENQGRLGLAKALLSDVDFRFNTHDEIETIRDEDDSGKILTPRSLMAALNNSDGTKKDFLDIWSKYCDSRKKNMVKNILTNYVDVNDKANQALKKETKSQVFGKSQTNMDKVNSILGNL